MRILNEKLFQPPYEPPPRDIRPRVCRHKSEVCSSSSDSDDSADDAEDRSKQELDAKLQHPQRLHLEMWFNDPGEVLTSNFTFLSEKIINFLIS